MRPSPSRIAIAVSAAMLSLANGANAQQTQPAAAQPTEAPVTLSPIVVNATRPAAAPDNVDDPEQIVGVSKTGTPLGDLPMSVEIVPRGILDEQGAMSLQDAIRKGNVSGVNYGGTDSKGFTDHFMIRGLQAQTYDDGFSDGDQVNGPMHSLLGVERIEVLKGPGSALLGSGPPGGSINLVHYTPSAQFHWGGDIQAGSFGTVNASGYVTGPTGIDGLNYRVDASAGRSDGYRALASWNREIRPDLQWKIGDHKVEFSIDAQQYMATPDSYGIIYYKGAPIRNVPFNAKYSTPFANAHGNYIRATLTDEWRISDYLTINNRLSYMHHTLDFYSNGDSTHAKVKGNAFVGRQLRDQDDSLNTFDYQLEPVWKFSTGSIHHTLLTGFEYLNQDLNSAKTTADLPDISDIFAPVPLETSVASLHFQCAPSHSCQNDHVSANFYSLYATDQVDVTDRFKLRAGVRKDWFGTSLTLNPVPGEPNRTANDGITLVPGNTYTRNDAPTSWSAGMLYKLSPWMTPYFGVSRSYLANFNSENTAFSVGPPESALQYELGVKWSFDDGRYVLNTALFDVKREHVATPFGEDQLAFDSQRTRGGEASFDADLTSNWHVYANFTGQQAHITYSPDTPGAVGTAPQGVPAFMANLWTTYRFSLFGRAGFHAGAGIDYMSRMTNGFANGYDWAPASVIANLQFGYAERHWGADLNIDNVTNQRYFIATNVVGAYLGSPLAAYVRLHADF
ncbi:iron complex outermembrane receptor protein [Paraburkholderia atlantica]|uniref:TonB-dependent receptor n=1 Tax=Paraburkholderia atlantica TaxID=2654982 RepID=UPI003D1973DB